MIFLEYEVDICFLKGFNDPNYIDLPKDVINYNDIDWPDRYLNLARNLNSQGHNVLLHYDELLLKFIKNEDNIILVYTSDDIAELKIQVSRLLYENKNFDSEESKQEAKKRWEYLKNNLLQTMDKIKQLPYSRIILNKQVSLVNTFKN